MALPQYKNRRWEVYFPSEADLLRWKNLAEEAGIPLSKWIYETIELHLNSQKSEPRSDISRELSEIKDENRKLRDDIRLKSLILENYESELYKLRHAAFENIDTSGVRKHDEELVALLKRGKTLDGYTILNELKIDPKDSEAVKLVSNQLENLRRYGLIKETAAGWKWLS